MDQVSMAHNTSSINDTPIKMEVIHTFDNIDGELNISMSDSVNSEIPSRPADIKTETALKSERSGKSVDDLNRNLSNGNIDLKLESRINNNWPAKDIYEYAATDQNYNLTCIETNKDLMVATGKSNEFNAGSEKPINFREKLVSSSGLELNNSPISDRTGINMYESSDNDLILTISENSVDSDTDEVDSDSSDSVVATDDRNEQIIQRDELPLEELQGSVLENHKDNETIDETLHEAPHENSATVESRSQDKRKKKSNTNQTTLLKFLVPRQSLMQESPGIKEGNDERPMVARTSISQLIMNSCVNCDKEDCTTFGVKTRKCKECGKRIKFNCFICEKFYNTRSGIYSHVVQFHRFSLKLFNEKIHAWIRSICSKCKSTFDSERSVCSKCNLNLEFGCVDCDERCESRPRIHIHVARNHTEEFVTSPPTADTNRRNSAIVNEEKGLLNDDEDQDRKNASLIDRNTVVARNSDSKQLSSDKRRVRFQSQNGETDRESAIEGISKSEAAIETLCPTPRYSVKRRSISAEIVASTETRNKSNSKITDKLSDYKQSISRRHRSTNANLDSSESKDFTEGISNNEDTTKTPTSANQQITGRRRSSRISLNSSEANSVSEAINNSGFKTSSSASKISGRRRSIQGEMQNSIKSDDDIPPKKPVGQQNSSKRRSSRISSDSNLINSQNASTSVDVIKVSEIFEPRQQITNKLQRSRSMAETSEKNNNREITFVDVHPVPVNESKQRATTGRRRSFQTMPNSSEASSQGESTSIHAVTPRVSEPMQQIIGKRRSIRNTSVNSEISSRLENSYMNITSAPKIFASKPSVMQGKRRSLRAMLDTSETNSHSESTSLDMTTAPEMLATGQVINKRRKSRNSISAEFDNRSEISINDSNNEISGVANLLHCSICQKIFVDQKTCKKHEVYCRKEPDIFCDSCSYATKYDLNLKKHKLIMHGPLKDPETAEAKTSKALLSKTNHGNVNYGALYTTGSSCTDILSMMEAYCPKCAVDAKMKPNDSNCHKCKSKLMLSCLKCCKVFADFLAIFNHLYKECSEKQYHCARCAFTTTSLDVMQAHVCSDHYTDISSNSRSSRSRKSRDTPFVFAAEPRAPVTLNNSKMKLKVGFKTREQSSVRPRENVAVETTAENEGKLDKCPKCNIKVHSLVKHLIQCTAELRCPFCSYMSKAKYIMKKHLVRCHNTKSHTVRFQALFSDKRITTKNRPDIEEMMRSYCKNCDELQKSVPYEFKCATCQTDLEYRCTKCQARFVLREQLRKHVWGHTKAANYLCCVGCSKGFALVENLRMHEKVCSALVNALI